MNQTNVVNIFTRDAFVVENIIPLKVLSDRFGYGDNTTPVRKTLETLGIPIQKISVKGGCGYKLVIAEDDFNKVIDGNLIPTRVKRVSNPNRYSVSASSLLASLDETEDTLIEVKPSFRQRFSNIGDATKGYEYLYHTLMEKYPKAVLRFEKEKSVSQFKHIIHRLKLRFPEDSIFKYLDILIECWDEVINFLYSEYSISISVWFPTPGIMLKFSDQVMDWYEGYKDDTA